MKSNIKRTTGTCLSSVLASYYHTSVKSRYYCELIFVSKYKSVNSHEFRNLRYVLVTFGRRFVQYNFVRSPYKVLGQNGYDALLLCLPV